jgi:hypothetical protein
MKDNQTPLPTAFCLVTEGGKHHSIQRQRMGERVADMATESDLEADGIDYAKSRFTR